MGCCCSLDVPPILSQKLILRYNRCENIYYVYHSAMTVYEEDYETEENCDFEWCDELGSPTQKCARCWMRYRNERRTPKYPKIQYKISNWVTDLDKMLPEIATKDEMRKMTFRYDRLSNILIFFNPDKTIYGKFTFRNREKNVIDRIQKYLET